MAIWKKDREKGKTSEGIPEPKDGEEYSDEEINENYIKINIKKHLKMLAFLGVLLYTR